MNSDNERCTDSTGDTDDAPAPTVPTAPTGWTAKTAVFPKTPTRAPALTAIKEAQKQATTSNADIAALEPATNDVSNPFLAACFF